MFMFIFYALLIYIASNGLGRLLLRRDSKFLKLRSIIGFLAILALLQVGYYPMQYLRVPSFVYQLWTLVVFVPILIQGIITFQKEDLFFLKSWEFYALLLLVFGLIKILPANEAGDDWFYMPLIKSNALIDHINTINPKTGWNWNVDSLYQYQGYYLFMSFIYRIQDFLFPSVDAIFISFRSTMSLLFVLFSSILLHALKDIFSNIKNYKIMNLIEVVAILLVGVLEWSHIYWGSFSVFPIFIPVYMLLLNDYVKGDDSRRMLLLLFISNVALISLVSSSLFLSGFLTFAFFVYSLYQKKAHIEEYYFILIPLFIYCSFFFGMPYLILPILLLYLLLRLVVVHEAINKWINNYLFIPLFLLPVLFLGLGVVTRLDFTWNIYRLGNMILVFNFVMAGWIFYLIVKKETIEPILFAFFIFVLFFFNPFTAPAISHFLTTTVVYYRLFYITKNPIVIFLILYSVYVYLKDKKAIYSYFFTLALILLALRYGYILIQKTVLEDTYRVGYDYVLRTDKDSQALGTYLDQLVVSGKAGKVLSIYFSPRQYNLTYNADIYRYPNDPKYEKDLYHKILFGNQSMSNAEYIKFKNQVEKDGYRYLIFYHDDHILDRVKMMSDIIYQNDTYYLCEVRSYQKQVH